MSHGGAQWCHRANTMDNLRTAVVKQLNRQKRHLQESYCGRPICVKTMGEEQTAKGTTVVRLLQQYGRGKGYELEGS